MHGRTALRVTRLILISKACAKWCLTIYRERLNRQLSPFNDVDRYGSRQNWHHAVVFTHPELSTQPSASQAVGLASLVKKRHSIVSLLSRAPLGQPTKYRQLHNIESIPEIKLLTCTPSMIRDMLSAFAEANPTLSGATRTSRLFSNAI